MAAAYTVIRTPAFERLVEDYSKQHRRLGEDVEWLAGRLATAPEFMGDHVPELKGLALPIFKARCKDSCCSLGASGAWRIYYAVHKEAKKVFLLFLHHKREYENPGVRFLVQKMERAILSIPKPAS